MLVGPVSDDGGFMVSDSVTPRIQSSQIARRSDTSICAHAKAGVIEINPFFSIELGTTGKML